MSKAKYWTAVLYPESLIDNWQVLCNDLLQVPFSYCIHDKDKDGHNGDRKPHVHFILCFPNTTTYKHALETFQRIQPNCNYCEQVLNIRYMYNYLIHNTESCKKAKKYLYDVSERVEGNNFDIGSFEQLSLTDKNEMLEKLCDFIIEQKYDNFTDFFIDFKCNFDKSYFEIVRSYSGMLERLCKGNYLKRCKAKAVEVPKIKD